MQNPKGFPETPGDPPQYAPEFVRKMLAFCWLNGTFRSCKVYTHAYYTVNYILPAVEKTKSKYVLKSHQMGIRTTFELL